MKDLPYGTVYTPNGLLSGLWALPRPLTAHWGQGDELMKRMTQLWGPFDVVFGKQDTVDGHGVSVDSDPESNPDVLSDWSDMPFPDKHFKQGYWDPPYLGHIGEDGDVHYKRMDPCYREMTRVCDERLVILSPLIYPSPKGWRREAVIATTMGPNKVVRAVQSFVRKQQQVLPGLDPMHGNALGQVGESHHLVSVGVSIEPAVEASTDGEGTAESDASQQPNLTANLDVVSREERVAVAVGDTLWERPIRRRRGAVRADVLIHAANASTAMTGNQRTETLHD